jgi:hypothetical protein
MSSSSKGDKLASKERNLQTTYEKQVKSLFDYLLRGNDPRLGSIIFDILGFAFLRIIGINIAHAQIRELTINIIYIGFFACVKIWVKLRDVKL